MNFHSLEEKIYSENRSILLSIVIPVYNEEKTIREVLEQLPKDNQYEIVVVDDNSLDNSIKEIQKVQEQKPIRLIKHKKNKGYGSALLTGIKNTKGKIVLTMDADGQHRPDDIYDLIQPIIKGEADITIGSRYLGSYNYKLPIATIFGELILEKLMRLIFRQKIKNNQGGFRAFNRRSLNIFNNIMFKDYAFTTEILLQAALKEYKIKECPITLKNRKYGSSKIILLKLFRSIMECFFYYTLKKINIYHEKKVYLNKFKKVRDLLFRYHPKPSLRLYYLPQKINLVA
ncbi:MAG: glycosyltransferase family 2 protein [Candidatus Hodarchaeota archaeon]